MDLIKLRQAIDKAAAAVKNDGQPVTLPAPTAAMIVLAAGYYYDLRQEEIE